MLIHCPHCGPRIHDEFAYLGGGIVLRIGHLYLSVAGTSATCANSQRGMPVPDSTHLC